MSGVPGLHEIPRESLLIELKTISKVLGCRILAKCEHMHPGGSVKDRAAHALVDYAVFSGQLKPGGTIVQGTGGNTGVSLAMIARARGYKCHLTIPENISPDKIELFRLLGADVTVCPLVPFADPRSYMSQAVSIASTTPGAVLPDQFENTANSDAHYKSTGPELWRQCGERLDGFVCSAGTGGTIAGVSRYLKEVCPSIQTHLIDPTGSGLKCFVETGKFSSMGGCFIDGIGIGRKTANFASGKVDGAFRGNDREAIEMAYYLLRNEGIFVGPSAALNVVGAVKLARQLGPGCTVATVLCDGGERYRATTYNKAWLETHGLTPIAEGTLLDFLEPTASDRQTLNEAIEKIILPAVLKSLPQEWLGTTFNNSALKGRSKWAQDLMALMTDKAISGCTNVTTKELEELGQAEDYMRVATNVSTLLEALIAQKWKNEVSCVFSFSSPTMPVIATALAHKSDRRSCVHVYSGNAQPLLNDQQCSQLEALGITVSYFSTPITQHSGDVVLCTEEVWFASAPEAHLFVDGVIVDPNTLVIRNESRIPQEEILLLRKRLSTPITTPVAIKWLEKCSGLTAASNDVAVNSKGLQCHLLDLCGIPCTGVEPLLFTAGLSALSSLFVGMINDGGVNVIMSPTAYGGSSQVADLLSKCSDKLAKHCFDAVNTPIVEAIGNALGRLQEDVAQGKSVKFARTVVFLECPTNPDMNVTDMSALATLLQSLRQNCPGELVLLLDTTLAPGSQILAELKELDPAIPVVILISLSKSLSRGMTTAGTLVHNDTSAALTLMRNAACAGQMLGAFATPDQVCKLAENHAGVENRWKKAHVVALESKVLLCDAVKQQTSHELHVHLPDGASTFSFNLPPPLAASAEKVEGFAQRFVDCLCANEVFKPCVSFGQDNELVYCTVPSTSTQGNIKLEDKARQSQGGVELVRLSFPPTLDMAAASRGFADAATSCYSNKAFAGA